MLQKHDLDTLALRGITEEKLNSQLEMLANGFPWLKVEAPATIGNGIKKPNEEMEALADKAWKSFLHDGGKVVKMVPASGAASRMFKDLYEFYNSGKEKPDNEFMHKFFDNLDKFAFFHRLNFVLLTLTGYSADSLMKQGRYQDVIKGVLLPAGINYGKLPKALLQFHRYPGTSRVPIEDHMAETAQYGVGKDGVAHLHFTVSEEHVPLVLRKIEEKKAFLEKLYGVEFDITLSVQKESTDTVASNLDGTPYRENGELFFRPGGHGALIENLNDIDADVVFIKNIDNVVPDSKREITNRYKRLLGGVLIGVRDEIFKYMHTLHHHKVSDADLDKMLAFLRNVLCITHDGADSMSYEEKVEYVKRKLNRPIRVCGMVRNEGEPGGGPFLAYNPDGTVSPQILESVQLDPKNPETKKLMAGSTHFNPVDLVCSIRDWKGHKFNLPDFVDPATGFISTKSREGVEIKALELPGLWNGAMSDWNTIFVEVPAETFNPVKTVNDLLRPAHLVEQ